MTETCSIENLKPFDPETLSCPQPSWKQLRKEAPVYQVDVPGVSAPVFMVTRRSDIKFVAEQPELFSNNPPPSVWRWGNFEPDIDRVFSKCGYEVVQTLATSDPPDSLRYRAVIDEHLNIHRIKELEPKIKEIVKRLADNIPSDQSFDLVELFSIRLPFDMICMILGVPADDWQYLLHYSDEFVALIDPAYPKERAVEAAETVSAGYTYLANHILAARENPHSGLISSYANARMPDGTRFAMEESISMANQSVIAGNETTRNAISTAALQLATQKELWQRIDADRSLIDDFIEESLRLSSPSQTTPRLALADTEINGVKIPKGAAVFLIWGSGNLDEEVFECPEKFNLSRKNKRAHNAFGMGIHHCSGKHLARAEIKAAIEYWLDHFETFDLAVPESEVNYLPIFGFKGLGKLPLIVKRR